MQLPLNPFPLTQFQSPSSSLPRKSLGVISMREYSLKVYDISAKGMRRIPYRNVLNTFQLPRKPNSIAAKDTSLTGDNYCHLGQMILPQTQLAAGHRLMNDAMNSV